MHPETSPAHDRNRWTARPFLSALLRVFIFLAPSVASLATALLLARLLGPPRGGTSSLWWWVGILAASFVVLYGVQRLVRRLAPLAVLLGLTLAFPDRAPSRYRVARTSGNVAELRARLADARDGDLNEAATTILSLVAALSSHDRHTRGHSERVRVFADMLAEELGLPPEERDLLRWAALLHDVGKLEVPPQILNKEGPLDEEEWKVIRQHPVMGVWLMGPLAAWLGEHVRAIEQHHERYDGNGYPNRLSGEHISIGGRIVAVADAYETMTAARSYKKPLSAAIARQELSRHAGKQFDPAVVRAMLSISLGRLWWRVGLVSWLAQLPLFGAAARALGRAGQRVPSTAGTAMAAAAVVTAGIAVPMASTSPTTDAEPGYQTAAPSETADLPTVIVPVGAPPAPERRALGPDLTPAETPTSPGEALSEGQVSHIVGGFEEAEEADDEPVAQGDASEEEGSADGQGGEEPEEDPSLIRYIVETVEETVEDLPPLPEE